MNDLPEKPPPPTSLFQRSFFEKRVSGLKPAEPITLRQSDSVLSAIEVLQQGKTGSILIEDDLDMLVGIFTERDLLRRVALQSTNLDSTPLSQVMTRDPEVIRGTASIARALHMMGIGQYRHLPVVHRSRFPVAVISIRDMLDHLYEFIGKASESGTSLVSTPAVRSFLASDVSFLRPWKAISVNLLDSVQKSIEVMQQNKIGSVVVVDSSNAVQGIFTERDYLLKIAGTSLKLQQMQISDYMTPKPQTVRTTEDVATCFKLMSLRGFRHIPVVNESNIAQGVLSVRNFIEVLSEAIVDDLDKTSS